MVLMFMSLGLLSLSNKVPSQESSPFQWWKVNIVQVWCTCTSSAKYFVPSKCVLGVIAKSRAFKHTNKNNETTLDSLIV